MSKLQNSIQENNYYFLSSTEDKILVGSDTQPDFEIDLGDFEYYLTSIGRIGVQYYVGIGDDYNEESITMEEWINDNDQCEIDDRLTEYIQNGGLNKQPDTREIPLPVSDTYELVSVGQRATYFEERYLKYIL